MLVDRGEHIACLLRQDCIVSSSGAIVNKELKSKEHITSLLWLYDLAKCAKLKEALIVN